MISSAALKSQGVKGISQIKWASSVASWLLPPDKWEACAENPVILLPACFTRALLSSVEKVRAFTEYLGLEGTRKDHAAAVPAQDSPTVPPCSGVVQTLLEAVSIPGEPCSVPDRPLGEEPFPEIQSEPPLAQLQRLPRVLSLVPEQRSELPRCRPQGNLT